jgi:hypothetical protein
MIVARHHTFLARYLLALLLFNLAACSSMQTVGVEQAMNYSPPRGVDFGSLVQVRTLDHKTAKFRVTEITDSGLGGKPGFFRYEDMESLKVEQTSSGQVNWGAIIGAILGVAALVFLIDNADSVSVCSIPPCPRPEP